VKQIKHYKSHPLILIFLFDHQHKKIYLLLLMLVRSNNARIFLACSVGWFVSLLVREEVLLAGLCERNILFWLEIYDRLRQATAK